MAIGGSRKSRPFLTQTRPCVNVTVALAEVNGLELFMNMNN
jgi:hypothetical protein